MKKLLAALLATISLTATAKENIVIMYAWGPGDSVANYHRTLAAEANKIQNKYNFLFDTKPGAGGAIAANTALREANTVLAHSTAFFVRPNVYPNESYDLNLFREQFVHCMAPMAVTSTKFKSWSELGQDAKPTIGISGLGVTTHLAALQIQKRYPNMTIVPFRSTSDSMLSMVSGQTDFHIGFISEAEQWSKENTNKSVKVNVLGITGTKVVNGYVPMVRQGFDSTFGQMNVGHHLLVPKTFDSNKHREFYDIFAKASQAESVRKAYAVDYCDPQNVTYDQLDSFFSFHTDYWKRLSSGIKLN